MADFLQRLRERKLVHAGNLRLDPAWHTIRDDAGFKALLKGTANTP